MIELKNVMNEIIKAPKQPATIDTPEHVSWLLGLKQFDWKKRGDNNTKKKRNNAHGNKSYT